MTTQETAEFKSIHHPSVVEQIIDVVKNDLIKGNLKPGQRLPSEPLMARQLGVGRSALREAMKVLEALGVIHKIQGSGTFIAETTSPKLLDPLAFAVMLEGHLSSELLELRIAIQLAYCDLAATKATADDWTQIEDAAQEMEAYSATSSADFDTLTQFDLAFHYAILEATHNPLLNKIGRTVEEIFFLSIREAVMIDQNWALESHRRIIQSMRSQDSEAIKKSIQYSMKNWKMDGDNA